MEAHALGRRFSRAKGAIAVLRGLADTTDSGSEPGGPGGRKPSWIISLAYFALALGFGVAGWQEWLSYRKAKQALLAAGGSTGTGYAGLGESAADAQARTQGAIRSVSTRTVYTIDQRVAAIRKLIVQGSLNPKIMEAKSAILSRKTSDGQWAVPAKDYEAEAKALYYAVVDPRSPYSMRYTRDHPTVDVFTAADKLLKLRAGDCDDLAVLLGALLRASGQPDVYLVIIQARGADQWSHIFVAVKKKAAAGTMGERTGSNGAGVNPDDLLFLDASMQSGSNNYKPAGWAAPGLAHVLKTGQPSGVVVKAKLYRV